MKHHQREGVNRGVHQAPAEQNYIENMIWESA